MNIKDMLKEIFHPELRIRFEQAPIMKWKDERKGKAMCKGSSLGL